MNRNKAFLESVQQQYDYLMDGATSYRRETACISLILANKVCTLDKFLNRNRAKQEVINHFPKLSEDRVEDVAKYLYTIAMNTTRWERIPNRVLIQAKIRQMRRRNFQKTGEEWADYEKIYSQMPKKPGEPEIQFKKLMDYCEQKGKEVSELSEKEIRQFLIFE